MDARAHLVHLTPCKRTDDGGKHTMSKRDRAMPVNPHYGFTRMWQLAHHHGSLYPRLCHMCYFHSVLHLCRHRLGVRQVRGWRRLFTTGPRARPEPVWSHYSETD